MKYYLPKKIYSNLSNSYIKNLYKKIPLQINLKIEECVKFGKGDYILLDFGKEMCGGLRVLTCVVDKGKKFAEGKVRITFGESYFEAMSDIGELNSCNDHALRDIETELTSYSDMTFCDTGYRFVKIEFLEDAEYLIRKLLG